MARKKKKKKAKSWTQGWKDAWNDSWDWMACKASDLAWKASDWMHWN